MGFIFGEIKMLEDLLKEAKLVGKIANAPNFRALVRINQKLWEARKSLGARNYSRYMRMWSERAMQLLDRQSD